MTIPQQAVIIFLMMLMAFFIQELPTSNLIQTMLPEWPFLLTLYFSVSIRYFFSVMSAFCIGLLQDVFLGVETIGLHAGIYTLATFIIITSRLRFRYMSVFSQSVFVAMLVALKVVLCMVYGVILYSFPDHFLAFVSIPLSIVAWPIICLFFLFFARNY